MKPDRLPFAALLVAATAAALGCADHGIIGPTPGPDATPVFQASATSKKGVGTGGVPSCSTVLVGMIRQTVGPAGGVVALGPARLAVAPGARSGAVTVRAQIPAGYSGNCIQRRPVRMVFRRPGALPDSCTD